MEISELKAFIAVAEELNFRKAADRLAMSQPPLTRTIARLEDHLGVELFVRTTRRVTITPAGVALLKEAREILAKMMEAEQNVRGIGRLRRAELQLGFTMMALYSSLPSLVWTYRELGSGVKVELATHPLSRLLTELNHGRVDMIFCEGPVDATAYETMQLASEELGVLLPLTHPLSQRRSLHLSDLTDATFILHPRAEAPRFHDSVKAFLDQHQGDVRVRIRKRGESCPALVATGKGILLAARSMTGFSAPGTRFIPLKNPAPRVGIYAVWRRERPSLPLLSFIGFLKEQSVIKETCSGCLMGFSAGTKS
ncbi:LysR family transcriptional regulator [Oligoflexus tunisiensis]|uniref:LysR family transcriptional regulator n=1 Tax=Oligoflexus tunisiensis TaxID=708132 RepID=UPI000A9B5B73|nr:LysR family transcriptional regulator [Oligoflexus tunisiensis]